MANKLRDMFDFYSTGQECFFWKLRENCNE